ncbi:MAG: terminase small subunit [Planctomycetota bacterium]|jgi:hypothetical protein
MTDFDNDAPLNRIKGESKRAHNALMDYFLMGGGRSLRKLGDKYVKLASSDYQAKQPPTKKENTLMAWSVRHHWQARIARQTEIDNEIALEQFRQRLSDMGRADMAEFADVRSPADLEGKLNSHVVKKIVVQARRHKDGTITAKTTIELYDAKGALDSLARHLRLFEGAGDSEDKPLVIKVLKNVSMDDL